MLAGSNTLGWTERFGVVCVLPAPSCSKRRVSGARVFREGCYALALPYLLQQYILRSGEPRRSHADLAAGDMSMIPVANAFVASSARTLGAHRCAFRVSARRWSCQLLRPRALPHRPPARKWR